MDSNIILGVALSDENRRKIEEILPDFQDARFIASESANEAKLNVKSEPISVIFVEMSFMNKWLMEFCQYVKGPTGIYIPLIIITDTYRDNIIDAALETNCDDVIPAHLQKNIFKVKLNSYLRMKKFSDKLLDQTNGLTQKVADTNTELSAIKDFSADIMLSLKAGIQVVDSSGKIAYENEAAKLIVGSAIGRNADEFYHSKRFMTSKNTNLHLKEINYFDEVDINTHNGRRLILQKMKLRKKNDTIFQVLLIKDTEKEVGQEKIDHSSLKSFLNAF